MNFISLQLQAMQKLLESPMALVGAALLLLLPVVMLMFDRFKWAVIALLLFVSGLGRERTAGFPALIGPLRPLEAMSRFVMGFLLVVLLLPTLRTPSGNWRKRLWLWGALAFCFYQFVLATRDLFTAGDEVRAPFEYADYAVMFLVLIVGVSRWLQSVADARWALRSMVWMGVLFALATLAQIASGAGYLQGNRLCAICENSNFAGEVIVCALPATLYFLFRKEEWKLTRIFAAVFAGLLVVFLCWTGSRGALLMSFVAVAFMFRQRMGRAVLAAVVVGLIAYGGIVLLGAESTTVDRLTSGIDTRTWVWSRMWSDFVSSPIIGVGQASVQGSENSYLLTATRAGIVGVIPLLISLIMVLIALFKLHRRRALLGDDQLLLDTATGGVIATLVGGMFDGFLTANFSIMIFCLFINLSILAFISDGLNVFSSAEPALDDPLKPAYDGTYTSDVTLVN